MTKKTQISLLTCGIPVLIAVFIMAAKPFSAELNDRGQIMLGVMLITLSIWIFKPFKLSFSAGGLFLAFSSLVLGLTPAVVFSGFTQSAVWTLIPALFFGYALHKTGLGKRIALGIIKLFKPSYLSLIIAWVLIGVALSVLTPSTTVRVAIALPIAVQCCELCKLEKGSKGNSLILLTAFAMALIPGAGWLNGVLWGPMIQGSINNAFNTQVVTFDSWFGVMFLPMVVVTVLLVAGSLVVLGPKQKLSQEAIDSLKETHAGKMTRQEAITAVILVVVFGMFLTNRFHHIPDAAVCLAATFLFFLLGILEAKDFNIGVSWDLIVFIAMALSLNAIFIETGISRWLAGIIVPALAPIAGSPWLFMYGITIIMFLWRFVDVAAFIPTIAILSPILPSIQAAYHISPLLWPAIFIMAGNAFFLAYQNIWAVMGQSIAGDRTWTSKHLGTYGVLYFVACLVTLLAAIPMWINAGLFR
jgi:anion transporter